MAYSKRSGCDLDCDGCYHMGGSGMFNIELFSRADTDTRPGDCIRNVGQYSIVCMYIIRRNK